MSLPIATLTGANTIAQLIYNVNRIKTLAANTASTVANSTFQSALSNTNSYIATKVNTTTFNSALANTNSYIAMKANTSNPIFNGNIGIGISPTRTLDVNGYVQIGSTAVGRLGIGEKLSTGSAYLELGEGRSGSGYAVIDLVGDTTYTDYGFRILRGNSGPNTNSDIYHRGTGNFNFVTQEAAPIQDGITYIEHFNTSTGASAAVYNRLVTQNAAASGTIASGMIKFRTGEFRLINGETSASGFTSIYVGGTERARIDSSGNLGIGTTTATNLLDVFTTPSAGGSEGLTVRDGTRSFRFGQTGSTFSYNGVGANENLIYALGNTMRFLADGQAIAFNAGTAERMRITSAGLVGIGTSSPNFYGAGFVTLQINSTTGGIIQATYGGTTAIAEILTTSGEGRFGTRTNHPMILKTNNTERMRITAAGKVGIGTSNPLSALHVNGSVSLNQSYEAYLVNAYYDGAWKYLGNGVAWGIGNNFNGAANSLTLATAAVNAGGAAAALTWVPALSISVAGAATFAGRVGVGGAPGTNFGTNIWGPELQAVGGQGIASLRASEDAFGGALNLAAARGTFGSPSIVLNNDALGAVYFDGFDGGDYLSYGASIVAYVDGTPGVNDMPTRLVFSTSADGSNTPTERMRIDSHGNLGIATAIDHNGRLSIKSTGTEQHLVLEQENVTGDGWGIRSYGAGGGDFEISRMTGTTTFTPRVTINASGLRVHAGMIIYSTQIEQDNAAGLTLNSSHGSGGIYFNVAGSERARITSGGTFVVGTTAGLTSELIHARRTSGTISTLYNNGSTGDVLRLYHENTAVTAFSIWGVGAQRGFITSPVSSNGLIFGTSSTEQARFDANGLRIGTTAEVVTATGGELVSLQGTATKSPLGVKSSDVTSIHSWNTGSSAATRYHFIGWNPAGSQEFHLRRETNGDIRLASLLGSLQLDGNSNGILFLIAGSERMRITSAGLMGLGTSSPGNLLTINGGVGTSSAGGVLGIRQKGDTSDDGITISSSFANSTRLWVDSGGTFSIQSTFTNSNSLALTKEGRVGVGTTSPVTTLDVAGTARATQGTPYTTYTANTKTLALTDNGYYTRCSNTTLITITIPNNSTVAFPLGSEMIFFQAGSGNVLFVNAAGVTLNSKQSNKNLTGQYSAATLKKIATNTWDLIGDLA
jgi:hypothetical protein